MWKTFIYLILFFSHNTIFSQNLFHNSIFYGGVTCAGFSTGQGAGTDTIYTYIEPNSTIKKAYIFCYTLGDVTPDTIIVNGYDIVFDPNNVIMEEYHAFSQLKTIKLYYKDITSLISSNITNQYIISIFNENNLPINWGTWTATIYIEYENPNLSKINTAIWVNDQKYIGDETYYFSNSTPMDLTNPVALSIFSDRTCEDYKLDGTIVNINNNFTDTISGLDQSSKGGCNGVKGHFYYQNNTLYGLDDDTPDNTMRESDALADISSYLTNPNTYFLNLKHVSPNAPETSRNINLLFINAYTSPCDTFSILKSVSDTTICKNSSLQINLAGADSYSWQPLSGLNCYNCPNPIFTDTISQLYSVTATKNGCSQTFPISIKIKPTPTLTYATIPDSCGLSTGGIVGIANGESPLLYSLNNGTPQSSQLFSHLSFGNYNLNVTAANGCSTSQNVTVPKTIISQANYTAQPNIANPNTEVELINQSQNYTNSIWYIEDANQYITLDSFYTQNANYTFTDTGLYNVMLITYNQNPACADTTYGQIKIVPPFSINIPNVFTPNQDQINDIFSVDIEGAKAVNCKIYNRWGNLVFEYETPTAYTAQTLNLWNGVSNDLKTLTDGTYFYVITVLTATNTKKSYSGSVQVFSKKQ